MKEQFDRELRNHIKDTFDHYDDLMADDGWNQFKKHRNRKRRGLLLWYGLPSGIAAALALLWFFNALQHNIIQPTNQPLSENIVKTERHLPNKETEQFSEKPVSIEAKKTDTDPVSSVSNKKHSAVLMASNKGTSTIKEVKPLSVRMATQPIYYANQTPNNHISIERIFQSGQKQTDKDDEVIAPAALSDGFIAMVNTSSPPIETTVEPKAKPKKSAFSLAVDANTYYNFTSEGMSDHVNLGVGLLSELRLTKNLSVTTGIAFNRQNTSFDGDEKLASNHRTINSKMSAASVPSSLQTDARLTGFDIPVNLKYNMLIGKVKTFISSGISSYSLINQRYSNELSVVNYSLYGAPTISKITEVEKDHDGVFNNFQFARTLNLSFGILYPINGATGVSVEPFVKYPISGFGNEDLKIGSGGISLKYTFGK